MSEDALLCAAILSACSPSYADSAKSMGSIECTGFRTTTEVVTNRAGNKITKIIVDHHEDGGYKNTRLSVFTDRTATEPYRGIDDLVSKPTTLDLKDHPIPVKKGWHVRTSFANGCSYEVFAP